jgi:hypothetical protein
MGFSDYCEEAEELWCGDGKVEDVVMLQKTIEETNISKDEKGSTRE